MKKLLLFVAILFISFSWVSYAVSKFNYESALQIANEYITNSSFDENWKDHNPTIIEKWKEFHTDDDSKISYIEFKVSCDNNPDCWFVMVNFDWDDVTIPIASTSWNTPSEVLIAQNGGSKDDNKLYYFSPFDMYGENIKTEEVSWIDPVDNIDKTLEQDTKLTKEQKEEKRIEHRNELKNRIIKAKKDTGDFKKSDDFKSKRQELRDKKQSIPKEEVSYKVLPFANAEIDLWATWYVSPWSSDTYISWSSTVNCWSRIPCYNQYTSIYNNKTARSWCSPTAMAMIYWYYDRQWPYTNLITWTATWASSNPASFDPTIKSVINSLRTYMLATYVLDWTIYESSVTSTNFPKWIQYAKDKWYSSASATYTTWLVSTLFSKIKTEIDANRPIVIHLRSLDWKKGHSVVWYWYKTWTTPIVRINMGWGYNKIALWSSYYSSNIDYNISSMYYNKRAWNYADWVTVIKIQ